MHRAARLSLFGSGEADRGNSRCRISIEAESSTTYHSAWLTDKAATCKELRDRILRTLQLERG
jgi:hypothetical protein